jgi:hypothetical protein
MSIRSRSTTVMIPKRDNWRWVMRELTVGLNVTYDLLRRTASGNWIVSVTSAHPSDLDKVLDRATEKLA